MLTQEFGSLKVKPARMAGRGGKCHPAGHGIVSDLVLYGPRRTVRRLYSLQPARRKINVSAKGTLVGIVLLFERVIVIPQKALRQLNIDPAFVFGHQSIPANVPGVGTGTRVLRGKVRFLADQLWAPRALGRTAC